MTSLADSIYPPWLRVHQTHPFYLDKPTWQQDKKRKVQLATPQIHCYWYPLSLQLQRQQLLIIAVITTNLDANCKVLSSVVSGWLCWDIPGPVTQFQTGKSTMQIVKVVFILWRNSVNSIFQSLFTESVKYPYIKFNELTFHK